MIISKHEKNILAIEKFLLDFNNDFDIKSASIHIQSISDSPSEYSPKNGYVPFILRVTRSDNQTSEFSWKKHASDDEYPIYDKNGERYGFHEVKRYVEQKLPEAFGGTVFYKNTITYYSHNISEFTNEIKIKLEALSFAKNFSSKTKKATMKI